MKKFRNPFQKFGTSPGGEFFAHSRGMNKKEDKHKFFESSQSSELSATRGGQEAFKCDDYVLRYKLQSLATFQDVINLRD
jgi:hypothetical protein